MATRIPGGKSTVTPYVAAKGAAAFLAFVERTFGTDPALRVLNEDGTIGHSEVKAGGTLTFGGREDRAFMAVVTIMKTRSWGVVYRASSAFVDSRRP